MGTHEGSLLSVRELSLPPCLSTQAGWVDRLGWLILRTSRQPFLHRENDMDEMMCAAHDPALVLLLNLQKMVGLLLSHCALPCRHAFALAATWNAPSPPPPPPDRRGPPGRWHQQHQHTTDVCDNLFPLRWENRHQSRNGAKHSDRFIGACRVAAVARLPVAVARSAQRARCLDNAAYRIHPRRQQAGKPHFLAKPQH